MEYTSFDRLLMDVFREMGAHRPEQLLPGWSLSLSEIYALGILAERAPLSQQDLGEALALEKSSISRLVQQLERNGWVSRERDARDGRLRLLRLTDAGVAVAAQIEAHMSTRHAELFAQLTPEEQAGLLQGLSALRRALYGTPWRPRTAEDAHSASPHAPHAGGR
jgi:DNA-binding MarR family transcriptional regulator